MNLDLDWSSEDNLQSGGRVSAILTSVPLTLLQVDNLVSIGMYLVLRNHSGGYWSIHRVNS